MNNNLLIGYLKNNLDIVSIKKYILTAIKNINNADIVLIIANKKLNTETAEFLINNNIKIYYYNSKHENLYLDRFIAYNEFLAQNIHYTYILHTDLRDVFFQLNPFNFLIKTKITLSLENLPLKDQNWNMTSLQYLYSEETINSIKNNIIICSGIFGAPRNLFLQLCEKIVAEYNIIYKGIYTEGLDQPILNKIVYFDNFLNNDIIFLGINDNFCINLHLYGVDGLFKNIINIHENTVFNKTGLYSIVHQYDRVKSLKHEPIWI